MTFARAAASMCVVATVSSSCTLWLALDCPYDCDRADATAEAAEDAADASPDVAAAEAGDAGCAGPFATSLDGVRCLDVIDVGEAVAAIAMSGVSIFIVGASGTVYACSDALCSSAPVITPTDGGPAHFGIAAAIDAGVFWTAGQNASTGVIYRGVSGQPATAAAAPAYASAVAVGGTSVFWTQSQGGGKGIRTCTLGASCTTGSPAGSLFSDAGLPTSMALTPTNELAWCDGTQVVFAGNQVATVAASVVASATGAIFWNAGTHIDGCDLPACSKTFDFDETTLGSSQMITQISTQMTGIAWLDQAPTIGICPITPQSSQQRTCSTTRKTFDLSSVSPPAGVPNGFAFNGSVVVLMDGTQTGARALRLVVQ